MRKKPIFYSAAEVAKIAGCSRTYVSQRIDKKYGIQGFKVGYYTFFTQENVDDFLKNYRPLKNRQAIVPETESRKTEALGDISPGTVVESCSAPCAKPLDKNPEPC